MAFDASGVWHPELTNNNPEPLPPGMAMDAPPIVPAQSVTQPLEPAPLPGQPVPDPAMVQGSPAAPTPVAATHGGLSAGSLKVPDLSAELAREKQASSDTAQAQTSLGQAEYDAGQHEAAVRSHGVELQQLEQEKIRAVQQQRDQDVMRINQDQQAAYDRAHAATIPDFYQSRPGTLALAAISMGLGEAGKGMMAFATGANVGNTAERIIDNSIHTYLDQKKQEVDNLFRYAAAKNQLGEQQKAIWAARLNDLQFEAAAMHQSMADQVLQVAAASKGRINQAQAQVMAKQEAQKAVQLETAARKANFDMQVAKRHLGIQEQNAVSARIAAVTNRQQQINIQLDRLHESQAQHVLGTMDKGLEKFTKEVKIPLEHGQRGIDLVEQNPNNGANWVHLIDAMIKSNTGRGAIMSQYQTLMGHTAGSNDTPEQVLEHFRSGLPSEKQRAAILNSAKQINNELRGSAKEFYDNFRRYDQDPAVLRNPVVKEGYVRRERDTFGTLPGYGQQEQKQSAKPPTMTAPNGTVYTLQPDGTYK
jgi:hypothetical protein